MRNIIICLINKMDSRMETILNQFDAAGYEVNVFDNILENKMEPHSVFYLLNEILNTEVKDSSVLFLTESQQYLEIIYKIYNEMFDAFIYVDGYTNNFSSMNQIYEAILQDNQNFADLKKRIYLCESKKEVIYSDYLKNRFEIIDDDFYYTFKNQRQSLVNNEVQRIFFFQDSGYIFSGNKSSEYEIISLSDKVINKEIKLDKLINFNGVELEDSFKEFLITIDNDKMVFCNNKDMVESFMNEKKESINSMGYFYKRIYMKELDLFADTLNLYGKIFIHSFLGEISGDGMYYNKILKLCDESSLMDFNEKYFVSYQITRKGFVSAGLLQGNYGKLQWKIYKSIISDAKSKLKKRHEHIAIEDRNKELVVLITSQFLSLNHAPTKTILDRSYSLVKKLKKKVMIINTRDLLTDFGMVPFYNICVGNVEQHYSKIEEMVFKDISIPFYQTACAMPEISVIESLLESISKIRPYCIINIGGFNITADLASEIVPTINISTVMGLAQFSGQFYSVGKFLSKGEKEFAKELGIEDEQIIEDVFTYDFKPQTHKYKRSDFCLPENKKLILVAGARLGNEVTEEFLQILKKTLINDTYIVFAGYFDTYKDFAEKDEVLKASSKCLGFQDDMLAVTELCDIYVNPPRIGGGSSIAEAMYKGIPPVTLNFGDSAVMAGEDFCVASKEEMVQRIELLCKDKEYYSKMSQKAIERSKVLMDTDSVMERILQKVERSKYFK